VLLIKELADFVQIGLVAWQTGKRFAGARQGRTGSVGIDGGQVTITYGGQRFQLPIEEAAGLAGVGGAAARPRPEPSAVQRFVDTAKQHVLAALPWAGPAGLPLYGFFHKPTPEDPKQSVSLAPDPTEAPFGLREFVLVQEMGKTQRQQAAIDAQRELELLRQQMQERLAEARTDLERQRIQLEYGDRIAAREAALRMLERRFELEAGAAEQRFSQQLALQQAEQAWKAEQAAAEREWRARQAAEQADRAAYYRQLAADLAAWRKVETEKALAAAKEARSPLGPPGFQLGRIFTLGR
jgi:hypothetical protein